MNLPTEAESYISVALDALRREGGVIHYYTFTSRTEETATLRDNCREAVKSQGRVVREFSFCKPIREISPNRVQVALDVVVA
jgi:tRNA G37 N-methylase Trm5